MKTYKGSKIFTIDEICAYLNNYINKMELKYFWISGEVQNLRNYSSNLHFSLIKGNKSLPCLAWHNTDISIENGDKGKFLGRINYYENKNKISFNVVSVEYEGVGKLYSERDEVKKYCIKNGLFRKPKKHISKFNNIILITRYQSAAYNDIIHTIKNTYGVNLYILDSSVQGNKALLEIIENINIAEKVAKKKNIDAIILSRGGGSLEELWVFNEKELIERIFKCKTPFITAIGHDIDTSLCDHVADLSCITPTELGKTINKKQNKLDKIEKLDVMMQNLLNIFIVKIKKELFALDKLMDEINIDNLVENNQINYDNLLNKKKMVDNIFKNKIKNEIVTLDNIRLNCCTYIRNQTLVSVLDHNYKEIFDVNEIKNTNTYILRFGNRDFKIKFL